MKVQASVKKVCRNCKIVRRKGSVRVICKVEPPSQAASGLSGKIPRQILSRLI